MHSRFKTYKTNRAQMIAEYTALLAIITMAFVAMNTYIKRGLQGRFRDAVDVQMSKRVGETNFTTAQYEPWYYQSERQTNHTSFMTARALGRGVSESDSSSNVTVAATEIIDGMY